MKNAEIANIKNKLQTLCTALLGIIFLTTTLLAQSAATLRGQVVDETGAVIPGAQVTLTAANGQARNVAANANGEFSIPNVAPGAYQLTVTFDGFQPYLEQALPIGASNTPLKITLAVAAVSIETTISAQDPLNTTDPDKNMSATTLEGELLESLPDNEEDLKNYLQALAGPGAGGATGGQGGAQIMVDGFSGGRLPPREAIMQIRVNQNPYSAEFAQAGFARVEIITKPGNDQWRGSFNYSLRNSALDARNAFALVKPDVAQGRYSFNVSGPLIKKRMSFFSNLERRSLEGGSTIVATTLDGQTVANVDAPNASTFFNLRTDYLLNQKNTINVSYNRFASETQNREFSVRFGGGGGPGGGGPGGGGFGPGGGFGGGASSGGTYTLPERGSDSSNTNHTLRIGETFIINANLLLESRLQYQRERNALTAHTQGVAINVLDAFNGGGATCCPNSTTSNSAEWQEYLTWTKKKHTFKFGLQLEHESINDYNATNFNGTYTFANLEQYRRALNGEATAQQYTINRGDPALDYSLWRASWFAQDDWRVKPTLTLSLGLRHEFQSQLTDKNNFGPRVGLAWAPFKDRKTTFRFGGGVFYSRLTGGLYENSLRYDGVRQQSIIIRNAAYPDAFAGDPNIQIQNTIRRTLDPTLKAPYSLSFSASVERQLPWSLNGAATWIYARGVNQFRMRNVNAPLADNSRPLGEVGNVYQLESTASSKYNGLQVRLNRFAGRRLNIFGNYSLSWTNSDADGPQALPMNNYNLAGEWGRAATDRRHSLFIGGRVNLPYGLTLSPMVMASSGAPYNITTGFDDNGDTVINDRPAGLSRNAGLPVNLYSLIANRCIQGCAPGGTPVRLQDFLFANFPNGVSAEGPGSFNVNLGLSKTLSFGERKGQSDQQGGGPGRGMGGGGRGPGGGGPGGFGGPGGGGNETGRFNLQFSAQVTNLLNRVNYGQFSGVLGSPYFSLPSSAGGARQLELGIRFSF